MNKTILQIDEDQKVALLHAPFKGTTLFGEEPAKLRPATLLFLKRVTLFFWRFWENVLFCSFLIFFSHHSFLLFFPAHKS